MNTLWKIKGIERMLGIPVLTLLLPLIVVPAEECTGYWANAFGAACHCLVLWQGNWLIVQWMRNRYSGYHNTCRRLLLQLSVAFIYTTIACFGLSVMLAYVFERPPAIPPRGSDLLTCYTITFFVISIYESVYFSARWKEVLMESERLKRENLQSQLETLKIQVSPHFLFNTLNTLITIIPEDPQQAVEFVEKLAGVYRYILQVKDKELVLLADELAFCESYLFLMKMRYSDNLHIEWGVPQQDRKSSIPPLALQMLLENAIKHNVISGQKPLFLQISSEHGILTVKNNLQPKTKAEQETYSTKIGLDNIRKRYLYLTQQPIEVCTTTDEFVVTLPLLRVEAQQVVDLRGELPDLEDELKAAIKRNRFVTQ